MCSGSEDKFGHVMIWIIMTWLKQHYTANMSEAAPELPHKLLNTWVWVRWSFGAGLWRCSALTVTRMGTHILQVLSLGKRRKGGAREGGCSQLQTRRTPTHKSQPSHKCSLQGGDAAAASQHPALGVHAALGEMLCGAETGQTSTNPPFWLHKDSRVVTCPETSGAKCALVVQEEKQTETQVGRILIFGIVAVEVLVGLFLVLLKKLHRHKLKTIFNFKMT